MSLETEVTTNSRKTPIFPRRVQRFSRSLLVLERATFKRETPKHPELDLLGIGFDHILKFAQVANIFERNIGGVQICTPPPLFAG